MLESKKYASMFTETIKPLIEKKKEVDLHDETVIEAYDKLNNIINPSIEIESLSLVLKIEKNKEGICLSKGSKIEVDVFKIGYKNVTLNFYSRNMLYHHDNLIIHLEPNEEIISTMFTGGVTHQKRIFNEKYILEYVLESKEWNLCISDSNGSPQNEELFTKEGFMRILYNTFADLMN